ncbi:carbonic anhydrase 1-like [Centruroides sculpturatus]|uniref:carbonic anhydrase 1-like n=1 Tax=Centruroides sculpturatus TaxID=218467 RepID=UPI000C6EBECF|nr:carbonic anhydrase 1-like [Centruroides sculpturatus]
MAAFVTYFLINLIISIELEAVQDNWSYEGLTGPKHWKKYYPACGRGDQSPIDIFKKGIKTILRRKTSPLTYNHYENYVTHGIMKNVGSTVTLHIKDIKPSITFETHFKVTFNFEEIRFHWGDTNSKGTEHVFDGEHFALEMQLIHYDNRFESYDVAKVNGSNIAILAVLYEASTKENKHLTSIIETLDEITYVNQEARLKYAMKLRDMLPSSLDFIRYDGSLTIPPCTSGVSWWIYRDLHHISDFQISKFRKLSMTKFNLSTNAWGNIRPLTGRFLRKVEVYSTSSFNYPMIILHVLISSNLFIFYSNVS